MKAKTKKILYTLLALAGAALIVFLMVKFYRCPIKLIFDFSCPGCGFTRAMLCAFKLDFVNAFTLFPIWPLIALVLVYFLVRIFVKLPNNVADNTVLWISCGALILQYVIRIHLGTLPA